MSADGTIAAGTEGGADLSGMPDTDVASPVDAGGVQGGDEASAKAAETVENRAAEGGDESGAQEGAWGNDWREKLAKGDEKKLERLKRFASPEMLWEAQEAAQRKISEGLKPKGKPGEKATDADWQAYRKEHGIPEVVDDYVKAIPMPDGRQIGDDDKPVLSYFSEKALKQGVSPSDMGVMVDAYYAMQEEQVAAVEKADADFARESRKALKDEYGGDFDANVAAMRPYFEGVNAELFGNLMGGRLADGSKIGNHPDIVRFFVAKSIAENPLATVVPNNGGNANLDTEIAALEKRMSEDRGAWFKDEKAQKRYRDLISARDKIKAAT